MCPQLNDLFDFFDKDQSGRVNFQEMNKLLRADKLSPSLLTTQAQMTETPKLTSSPMRGVAYPGWLARKLSQPVQDAFQEERRRLLSPTPRRTPSTPAWSPRMGANGEVTCEDEHWWSYNSYAAYHLSARQKIEGALTSGTDLSFARGCPQIPYAHTYARARMQLSGLPEGTENGACGILDSSEIGCNGKSQPQEERSSPQDEGTVRSVGRGGAARHCRIHATARPGYLRGSLGWKCSASSPVRKLVSARHARFVSKLTDEPRRPNTAGVITAFTRAAGSRMRLPPQSPESAASRIAAGQRGRQARKAVESKRKLNHALEAVEKALAA